MNKTSTPYANLSPDLILQAIESLDYRCSGSLTALNSYENRVYQVGIDDEAPLIAKFYRPARWTNEAILEEHEFAQELLNKDIPVVAPISIQGKTLHHFQDFRFALFPRRGGRALELDNMEQLEWMGRFIGRIHAAGACQPFQHRLHLNTQSYGHQPYRYLVEHDFIPEELKQNFCDIAESVLRLIEQRFAEAGQIDCIRLHGDCHIGNVLWRDDGLHIVDLDDCLMGPAVQDIWMLLAGANRDESKQQLTHILHGYAAFHDFNRRELDLIEPLRTLRMMHYSAWLAKRWEDPAFPANFPWFNTRHYWQEQMQHLREQAYLLENENN